MRKIKGRFVFQAVDYHGLAGTGHLAFHPPVGRGDRRRDGDGGDDAFFVTGFDDVSIDVLHDFKTQAIRFIAQVQGASIGSGQRSGVVEDLVQQAVHILFRRQRDTALHQGLQFLLSGKHGWDFRCDGR